tara:strand:+ start:1048 stop:2214 length:1167 start_codon:yes stop_codon:yes gene_type:complete
MNKLNSIIDFGARNLRLSVFNHKSEIVYSSILKIDGVSEEKNLEKSLNKLIRDAEKHLSVHLDDVNILYDTSNFSILDLSIKKSFDQPTIIKKYYNSLLDEANFIVSENNFKNQVLHIIVNNVIVDEKHRLEIIPEDFKARSLILEFKFICLNKSLIKEISNTFKKNNLSISNMYCSSYVKAIYYSKNLESKKNFIFLDIGFERSSALIFINNKLIFFNSIPLGGNNITKDISQILKLSIEYSEDLKIRFNKDENAVSYFKDLSNEKNLYSEISEKKISINLLKQIIEARVDEIIELAVNKDKLFFYGNLLEEMSIIFIGNGSKSFSNSYNLKSKSLFSEMIFFEENDRIISEAGFSYNKSEESFFTQIKKKPQKYGIFESFFNFFAK